MGGLCMRKNLLRLTFENEIKKVKLKFLLLEIAFKNFLDVVSEQKVTTNDIIKYKKEIEKIISKN